MKEVLLSEVSGGDCGPACVGWAAGCHLMLLGSGSSLGTRRALPMGCALWLKLETNSSKPFDSFRVRASEVSYPSLLNSCDVW